MEFMLGAEQIPGAVRGLVEHGIRVWERAEADRAYADLSALRTALTRTGRRDGLGCASWGRGKSVDAFAQHADVSAEPAPAAG